MGAFESSSNLKSLSISYGVKTIQKNAFKESALRTIVFPESLEFLAIDSFSDLNDLLEVYSPSPIPPKCEVNTDTNCLPGPFGDCLQGPVTPVILYVPEGCEQAYKNAMGWFYFRDIRSFDFSGIQGNPHEDSSVAITIDGEEIIIASNQPITYKIIGIDGSIYSQGTCEDNSKIRVNLPSGIYIVETPQKRIKIMK